MKLTAWKLICSCIIVYLSGLLWLQTFVIADLRNQIDSELCPTCELKEMNNK